MMRRVFQLVTHEVRGMHSAAYVLAVFTLLSSVLAFLRDRVLAHTFGAGPELDIYYAAFRIPDLIFVAIASLVSVYVLIPELVGRDARSQRQYVETVMAWFSVLIALVGLAAFVAAPTILQLLFPTLVASGGGDLLIMLTRIMLLQPVLLGFSNILAAITQVRSRYVLYAISPLLYNAGIILGVIVLYPVMGLSGLAWGVVLGALLHVGVQVPSVITDGFFRGRLFIGQFSTFLRTVRISLPRTVALSATQVAVLGLNVIAATLAVGSITIFTFAFNLQAVPLALIGASYSVAAFPTLARMFDEGAAERFSAQVQLAARHIIFWTLPAIGLIIVLRAHIVRVILGSGEFDWADTRLTAAALALFIVSLTAHALTLLLVRGYYAAGRARTPLTVSIVSAVSAVGLAVILLRLFELPSFRFFIESLLRVDDLPGTSVLALPLAYSIAAIGGAATLVFLFEKHFGGLLRGVLRVLGEGIAAAGLGGAAAYGVLALLGGISAATTFTAVLFHGLLAGLAGLTVVYLVFLLLGSRERAEAEAVLKRKVWKAHPVSSAESEL